MKGERRDGLRGIEVAAGLGGRHGGRRGRGMQRQCSGPADGGDGEGQPHGGDGGGVKVQAANLICVAVKRVIENRINSSLCSLQK